MPLKYATRRVERKIQVMIEVRILSRIGSCWSRMVGGPRGGWFKYNVLKTLLKFYYIPKNCTEMKPPLLICIYNCSSQRSRVGWGGADAEQGSLFW